MHEPPTGFDILVLTQVRAQAFLSELMQIDRDVPGQTWGPANFLSDLPAKWEISHIALHGSRRVAGYIIGSLKAEAAHIHRVAVARALRRSGLAMRLMGAAGAVMQQKGLSRVTAKVHINNDAARKMFQRLGWREVSQQGTNYLLETDSATLVENSSRN